MAVKRYVTESEYMDSCDNVIQASRDARLDVALRQGAACASQGKWMQGKERQEHCVFMLEFLSHWKGEKAEYSKAIFSYFSNPKNNR